MVINGITKGTVNYYMEQYADTIIEISKLTVRLQTPLEDTYEKEKG